MKVLGIDISKSFIVVCQLTEGKPKDIGEFYLTSPFLKLQPTHKGINTLLSLKADVAVIEPTGVNYSKLWISHLQKAGVEIRQVGHQELKTYRYHLDLSDKDDRIDSLALACYYFDYQQSFRRFVYVKDPDISQIRDISLRLNYYSSLRNPLINRIKQDLAWQFPEVQNYSTKRKLFQPPPLLWRWLAGDSQSSSYDKKISETCGLGLEDETTFMAQVICDLYGQEQQLEQKLFKLTSNPKFEPYLKVFEEFEFGLKISALILAQIYPIERFFGDNRQPETIKRFTESGNISYYDRSLARFKKIIGVAPERIESGERKSSRQSGGSLIRKALWQWIFTKIEPRKSRLKNEIGQKLGRIFDEGKLQKQPIRKLRGKARGKTGDLLYKKLVAVLIYQ